MKKKFNICNAKKSIHAILAPAKTGDCVEFGQYHYHQNTLKPVQWRILSIDNSRLLLISECILDSRAFELSGDGSSWESSSVRDWLNHTFFNMIFNEDERKYICETMINPDLNPSFSTDQGRKATDHIFLLSINESRKYFTKDSERRCQATDYARKEGLLTKTGTKNCCWWLRTVGERKYCISAINYDGKIIYDGLLMDYKGIGIRPAVWIDSNAFEIKLYEEASTNAKSNDIKKIRLASEQFFSISDYLDSEKLGEEYDTQWHEMLYEQAISMDDGTVTGYKNAINLLSEIESWKDSKELIDKFRSKIFNTESEKIYNKALAAIKSGTRDQLEKAATLFRSISGFKDSKDLMKSIYQMELDNILKEAEETAANGTDSDIEKAINLLQTFSKQKKDHVDQSILNQKIQEYNIQLELYKKSQIYNYAFNLKETNVKENLIKAAQLFLSLDGYSDSNEKAKECERIWKTQAYEEAIIKANQSTAESLNDAMKLFHEIGDWKDSLNMVKKCDDKLELLEKIKKLEKDIFNKKAAYNEFKRKGCYTVTIIITAILVCFFAAMIIIGFMLDLEALPALAIIIACIPLFFLIKSIVLKVQQMAFLADMKIQITKVEMELNQLRQKLSLSIKA